MSISKREAKAILGLKTDADLARFLGISRQALHAIDDDEPLPDGRQWQLRALRSDLFSLPYEQGKNAA